MENEIKNLIKSLGNNDEMTRINVKKQIEINEPGAIKQLITALADADENIRNNAALILIEFGEKVTPYLITELYENDNIGYILIKLNELAVQLLIPIIISIDNYFITDF